MPPLHAKNDHSDERRAKEFHVRIEQFSNSKDKKRL